MRQRAWKALHAPFLALALPVAAQPYVDNVLDDGPQPVLVLSQDLARSSGWPRGWRVEYNIARDTAGTGSTTQGVAFSGFLDTPAHGALSVSAALNKSAQGNGLSRQDGTSAGLWRVDQVGFPLDGGWMANHSAGALSTLNVPLARGFGRIGLPSSPIQGLTAEYRQGGLASVNGSIGRPGLYSGLGVNGFDPARGRLLSVGGQQALNAIPGASSVAVQAFDASGIADTANPEADQHVRGLWSGWRWEGVAPWASELGAGTLPVWQREGGLQLQANLMGSRASGEPALGRPLNETGKGAWIDAQWRGQWLQQAVGAFYLQPNLRWGSYNVASDLRGAYWRGDVGTRRWQLSASAEMTDSVSGLNGANLFMNLSSRYRVDTRNTAFGSLAVRRINDTGESAQLGWEHASELGQTRWIMDVLRATARRSYRVGVDHTFMLASENSLTLSAALERMRDHDLETRAFSWGLIGTARPWSSVTVDANLRGAQGSNARQLIGGMGLAWAIHPGWSLAAQFSSMRGEDPQTFALVSSLTQASSLPAPVLSARRVQLTLRYEDRAGTASAPLGGAPGAGAGSIRGTVFFDADNNGRREASESGAPNVTIVLDRRYVTRTDAQGNYEFPWVVAGRHVLQIQTDNVPLPWNPVEREPVTTSVVVRSSTTTDFALQRDR